MGRQSSFTKEVGEAICQRIATSSDNLHKICQGEEMPSVTTVMNWLNHPDHKEFVEQYARAREAQADFMGMEILDIADDSSMDTIKKDLTNSKGEVYDTIEIEDKEWVNRSKLRVDARKWLMSKLAPKKYGDKLDLTSDGQQISPPVINVLPKTK